jgi:trimeric autotransporter adhesin
VRYSQIYRVLLALAALGMLTASLGLAQNFVGGIRGSVQDPGGAVIGDAKVTLLNEATGTSRTTQSNASGEYAFAQVEPATYSIVVEAPGFKKLTRTSVIVGTQETVGVDLKLEIGQVSESVQVTGEIALIENTNASNGQVLNEQQIADLPNLGRNVFLLSKLANNIATGGDPRFNRFQDQSGSSQISVAGGPIRGNN